MSTRTIPLNTNNQNQLSWSSFIQHHLKQSGNYLSRTCSRILTIDNLAKTSIAIITLIGCNGIVQENSYEGKLFEIARTSLDLAFIFASWGAMACTVQKQVCKGISLVGIGILFANIFWRVGIEHMKIVTMTIINKSYQNSSSASWFYSPMTHIPGVHTLHNSPVYGNRYWEIEKIMESSFFLLLKNFTHNFYTNNNYRNLIKKEDIMKCQPFAYKEFENYISKYAFFNWNAENLFYVCSDNNGIGEYLINGTSFAVTRVSRQDVCFGDFCGLSPLINIHELMHLEEAAGHLIMLEGLNIIDSWRALEVESWGILGIWLNIAKGAQSQKYSKLLAIGELFTTLKGHILTDKVFKECHGYDLDTEIDYKKELVMGERKLPAGQLANVYRKLEKIHGSLSAALLSDESIAYLQGNSSSLIKLSERPEL